jgi:hypothetical protein
MYLFHGFGMHEITMYLFQVFMHQHIDFKNIGAKLEHFKKLQEHLEFYQI